MATNPPPRQPPPPPPAKDQPGKRWLILIVGAVLAITMAYLSGLRTAVGRLRETRQELARTQSRAEAAEGDVARRDATIRRLEARRQIHLALITLDQRNFGTAQNHLKAAAILLDNAGDGDAATLAQQIKATNLVVASDFSAQRERVLDFARRLDAGLSDRVPDASDAPAPAP